MKQKLIVLRGTSNSGKTTVCKLVRNYDEKIAWVTMDNVKVIFAQHEERTLDDANETAVALVRHLLDKGFSVIIDGIFKKPSHFEDVKKVADGKGIPLILFQLECSLETLKKRDKNRDGVKQGLWPPLGDDLIERLYNLVNENPIEGSIKLSSEEMPPEEIADRIRKSFEE